MLRVSKEESLVAELETQGRGTVLFRRFSAGRRRIAFGLFFALAATGAGLSAAADENHPCRYGPVAQGKPLPGATASRFVLKDEDRIFTLSGLLNAEGALVIDTETALTLHAADMVTDRYRRIPVQAFAGENWLQGDLLKRGEAFQFALGQTDACIEAMRSAEHLARKAKSGVWKAGAPVFGTTNTDALLQQAGKFAIIRGIVASVGDRKRRLYLNFGSNWAEDVTAVVVKSGSGAYRGDVAVLQKLEGRRVEIRGIVNNAQGPLIRLIDEAQIDILDP